ASSRRVQSVVPRVEFRPDPSLVALGESRRTGARLHGGTYAHAIGPARADRVRLGAEPEGRSWTLSAGLLRCGRLQLLGGQRVRRRRRGQADEAEFLYAGARRNLAGVDVSL